MIKWTGKNTAGTWTKEIIANDYEELLEELINHDIIDGYWNIDGLTFYELCKYSKLLEDLQDEYQEAIEEDDNEKMEDFQDKFENINWHKKVFSKLSEDDFKQIISSCKSQAYYQTFEFIKGEE